MYSRFSLWESNHQQIPTQNLKDKKASRETNTNTPQIISVFISWSIIYFVFCYLQWPCCMCFLKACAPVSRTFSTDKRSSLSAETQTLSLCVSQKTFHKSNADGHKSNLQPEGQSHRVPAEFEHGNMQSTAVSGTTHKGWWIWKAKTVKYKYVAWAKMSEGGPLSENRVF